MEMPNLKIDDIRSAIKSAAEGGEAGLKDLFLNNIPVSSKRRFVIPKTDTQRHYIEAIRTHDIVIGIGPAGTGKTYLAMAMAISAFLKKEVSRIVLARPAIEAGERLGFLPGDMLEKVNPYLRPLYDALYDMMDVEKASKLMEMGIIEIAPLAFMRGRTLNDSFIILDEAQNTTSEQMKMYLTRLGFNSKTVITGDITQIDLPPGRTSGLVEAQRILEGIKGISFIFFSEKDVVRHKLVQEIVKAYEKYEKRNPEA
jgi:phosphate starvation-inducible PhoH-like protein